MITRRRTAAAAATAVLAVVGIGYGASHALGRPDLNSGPLGGGGGAEVCSPTSPGQSVAFGGHPVKNTTEDAITLDRVQLVKPVNVTLRSAVLVPLPPGGPALGGVTLWPPVDDTDTDETKHTRWNERFEAAGSTIAPGASFELVLELATTTADEGTVQAVDLRYTAGGREYRSYNDFRLHYTAKPSGCDAIMRRP